MPDEEHTKELLWMLEYADHSGNRYRFWQVAGNEVARFSYDPVLQTQSSSGVYSGGDPRTGNLDTTQVDLLFKRVRSLEESVDIHAEKRRKGTGFLRIRENKDKARQFLIRNGQSLRRFDRFLEPFRGKPASRSPLREPS